MRSTIEKRRRVRICVIGFKSLSRLVHSVAEEFEAHAEIEVIDEVFDRSLKAAAAREEDGRTDVFISAGANAAILRSSLASPVAAIKISGFDVWLALLKARQISERIGIATYGDPIPEIEMGKDLLRVQLSQRCYRTVEEARDSFAALAREGCQVIIGSSVIVDMAEQNGRIHGVLAYSAEAVRQAFNDALELARVRNLESARFRAVDAVLQHLHEAVIAVDREGLVTAINPAMESLLGVAHDDAIGRAVESIAAGLGLSEVIDGGEPQLGRVICLAGGNMVGNRVPVKEFGIVTGALLTLQDAGLIQRADGQLRSQKRPRQLTARYRFSNLLGASASFKRVRSTAERYANASSTVLISGESGTGKELFAQAIHNASKRRGNPFVAVNCAAFPEPLLESELFGYEEGAFTGSRKGGKAGLFETAHTGTVFLDEIGDMPLVLQTRLLRVLQEKEIVRLGGVIPIPVDVRIVAATHRPLQQLVREGAFRGDLFYRLNILQLRLPSLRERSEDVPMLALQLLHVALRRAGSNLPADQALAPLIPRLRSYQWPGNVRELENIAERLAVNLAAHSTLHHDVYADIRQDFPELYDALPEVPDESDDRMSERDPLSQPVDSAPSASADARKRPAIVDDGAVLEAIRQADGNRLRAAALLNMSRTTLWRRLNEIAARSPDRDTGRWTGDVREAAAA